jgi:hypothetical protein
VHLNDFSSDSPERNGVDASGDESLDEQINRGMSHVSLRRSVAAGSRGNALAPA